MDDEPLTTTSITLPDSLLAKVKEIAKQNQRSFAAQIRVILLDYVKTEEAATA
jgi:predicted transcriptional regulator